MEKTAIFWGNNNLNYSEDPIICDEAEENQILENLLIETIKKTQAVKDRRVISLIPGIFALVKGKKNHLENLKITDVGGNYNPRQELKEFLISSFLLLSHLYNPDSGDVVNEKDHLLSLDISMFLFDAKKERVSLRIDKGFADMLKPLGKKKIGEYINLKVADLVLRKHFQAGAVQQRIEGPFSVCFDAPILIKATEAGFRCLVTEHLKTTEYKETGRTLLVDYAINKGLLEVLRTISEKDNQTVTSLIKEGLIPRGGRWEEIELRPT